MKQVMQRLGNNRWWFFLVCGLLWGHGWNTVQAQGTVAIPDTAFERRLINLGIDTDLILNGQLSNSNAQGVLMLDVSNAGIRDLTGIQAFTGLRHLNCSGNDLRELEVTGLAFLLTLQCSFNDSLHHLGADSLPVVTQIRAEQTAIDTLVLRANPRLNRLFINRAKANWLDVSGCTALRFLYANNNQTTHLQTAQLPSSLEHFEADSGQLQLLQIQLPNLERLYVSHNALTELDVSALPQLDWLTCDHNPLTTLTVPSSSLVRRIGCSHTLLDTLVVSGTTRLQELNCAYSQLEHLDIRQCPNLQVVYTEHNQLAQLDLFQLPLLYQLDCGNNVLQTLNTDVLPNLSELLADSNDLVDVDLTGLQGIVTLRLNDNLLEWVRLKGARAWAPPPAQPLVHLENNPANVHVCIDLFTISWRYFDTNGLIFTPDCGDYNLYGLGRVDANGDCLPQATEQPTQRTFMLATSPVDTVLAAVDIDGYHRMTLDTGTYQIELLSLLPYRAVCPIFQQQQWRLNSSTQRDTLPIGVLQTTDLCPYLEVGLSAPFLRATGGGSAYTLYYCNNGTAPAFGAYAELVLDQRLQVLGTSQPIQGQQGNRYRFALGTVLPDSCGQIQIQVLAQSSVTPGTVLCSEARLYPDTLCYTGWNGPVIEAGGSCQIDSIRFVLRNKGGAMQVAERYHIFEDQVMLHAVPYFLGAGDSIIIWQPTRGSSSYRLEAQQPPGVPLYLAAPVVHHTELGCGTGGSGSFNGPFLSFYNDYTQPTRTVDCQAMIAAYDPNDKTPQPLGYGAPHYVEPGIPLHYRVRFQNTGNDTAFNVVILDTLSIHLDWTTLYIEGSSHAYTWSLLPGGVLRMEFANIRLVDSMTNEPLSHGYFRYRIQPKVQLPLGTRIENQAAIYFDYNPPIFTNTTWNTIGRDFYTNIIPLQQGASTPTISVAPQPLIHETIFEVHHSPYEVLQVAVHDALGRLVAVAKAENSNRVSLERGQLTPGVYHYVLRSADQWIGSGKLLVQ